MRNPPRVVVVMATFNGEKFLDKQIRSVVKQEQVEVILRVNDDGSEDATKEILHKWYRRGAIQKLSYTSKIGFNKVFFSLLSECSNEDSVAICDQDDVWEPDKLIKQYHTMTHEGATLVSSSRLLIDENDKIIGKTKIPRKPLSFANALVENTTPGNTLMLNRNALQIVKHYNVPDILYYDAWIYLLISTLGDCRYLEEPLVRYRLHDKNSVGIRKVSRQYAIKAIDNCFQQAKRFQEIVVKDCNHETQQLLTKFLNLFQETSTLQKMRDVLTLPVYRQNYLDDLLFKSLLTLLSLNGTTLK